MAAWSVAGSTRLAPARRRVSSPRSFVRPAMATSVICRVVGSGRRWCIVLTESGISAVMDICATEVVDKDRSGYRYVSHVSLEGLTSTDRHLISLFIKKGRGAPRLTR